MTRLSGFTLIEILVVLALIAILTTLAIPDRSAVIVRTQIAESIKLVENYKSTVEFIYRSTGRFPENNKEAGIPEPDKIKGNYVTKINMTNGSFTLFLGAKIRQQLIGKTVSIRPIFVENSPNSPLSWICGNDSVPENMQVSGDNHTNIDIRYLPINCR